MYNETKKEELKESIKQFVNEDGWTGFFGLLATISPQNLDEEDLKKEQEDLKNGKKTEKFIHESNLNINEQEIHSIKEIPIVKEASIYAQEHLSAVAEDMKEQSYTHEEPKKRVLEQNKVPNPWGDSSLVSPGQLKL